MSSRTDHSDDELPTLEELLRFHGWSPADSKGTRWQKNGMLMTPSAAIDWEWGHWPRKRLVKKKSQGKK